MMNPEELAIRHRYHPPASDDVVELHEQIRERTGALAQWMNEHLPASRETEHALTDMDNAMLHANAAVARHMNG